MKGWGSSGGPAQLFQLDLLEEHEKALSLRAGRHRLRSVFAQALSHLPRCLSLLSVAGRKHSEKK